MVSKRDAKLVLWPIYFDRDAGRPWRRVPKSLAVEGPTAEDLAKVAQTLRLKPVLEKGAAHPSHGHERSGRVLIDIRGSKSVLLRQIAEALFEARKAAVPAPAAPVKGPNKGHR